MSTNSNKMDLLIVDDHQLVRMGIRGLLQSHMPDAVITEADSGEAALQMIKESHPEIVLMDINMPGLGGLEATRKMLQRRPELRIIIVTAISDGPMPKAMLNAGAMAYITKGCSLEEMVKAIERVRAGEKYIAAEIAQQLALSLLDGDESSPFDKLSHRELQLVLLISQGMRNPDICAAMCVSPKTVSTYRTRMMQKLGISTNAELVTLAMAHGLTGDT